MLQSAIVFFILAMVSYIFGLNDVAGISPQNGRLLLGVFMILAILSTLVSLFRRGPVR